MTNNDSKKSRSPAARKALRAVMLIVLLAALAAAGWFGWQKWGAGPQGDQYIFATIQRGDIEDLVSATGSLQPRDFVDVGAQVSGQIRKIHVEVGSDVNEGDLLAEINAEQLVARVDASRAQLRARQADLVQQEVNLTKATRDLQRQRNLLAEEATTLELVQNAETTLSAARAAINSTRAGIEQLQATMRVDETNLEYTKIYAPMSGTVASITAKQGQTLNANQSAPIILRIADLSTMTVQTQVSEADVSRLRANMPSYFTTLGSQGRRWWGRLKKIEPTPTVTNNVVLYNALFDVSNPNRQLMTQMTAQVFFVANEARDVLVAPMSALTIARPAPSGGQRDRGAGATPAAGASAPAAATAGPASPSAPAASQARPPERAREGARTDASSGSGASAPSGERPRFDREAWNQMSDADRQRMRAERMAQRAQGGGGDAPNGRTPGGPRAVDNADRPRATARAAQSPGVPPELPTARAPRKATVKVETADGLVEEREVTIGVSNRVHAQILSGLNEGDRVVAGIKLPETARRGGPQGQQQGPQGAGGMPGGGSLGAPAGGRR